METADEKTVRASEFVEVQLGDVAVHARPGRAGLGPSMKHVRRGGLAWPLGLVAVTGRHRAQTAESSGPIGIYHSHNAESYVETSNEEFKVPQGDIVEVGRALKQALEEQGYNVIHSENSHLPHDGGAYQRSRATVQ